MDDRHTRKFQKELNAGLVALVLPPFSTPRLKSSTATRLPSACNGRTKAKPCSRKERYSVLRALSADGFLRSRIAPSDAGPPRRYYRITREGRALLGQWSGIWSQTRDFVDRFLRGVE